MEEVIRQFIEALETRRYVHVRFLDSGRVFILAPHIVANDVLLDQHICQAWIQEPEDSAGWKAFQITNNHEFVEFGERFEVRQDYIKMEALNVATLNLLAEIILPFS